MRRIAYGELANEAFSAIFDDTNREAREIVWALAGGSHEDWTEEQVKAAERVAGQFNHIGFLLKSGYVNPGPVMDMWGARFVKLYKILGPFIEKRRVQWQSPEHWIYLEWLSRTAWIHIERHRPWWTRRSWVRIKRLSEGLSWPWGVGGGRT